MNMDMPLGLFQEGTLKLSGPFLLKYHEYSPVERW